MPRRLIFDIEGDGLLDTVTRIHCIAAVDPDTGERFDWKPDDIGEALNLLDNADELWAHNGLGYDYVVLDRLYGFKATTLVHRDTLVASRLIYPDLRSSDHTLVTSKRLPSRLHSSHSLEAWGYRLGCPKAVFEGPWDKWTPEMHAYMIQDIETTLGLWRHLKVDGYSQQALDLEHRIAVVCETMTADGWPFDVSKAGKLHAAIMQERDQIEKELIAQFGSWEEVDKVFVPKRDNKRLGYTAGVEVTKYKTVTFNPGSRHHIFKKLQEMGWKPEVFTDSGQPKVDDDVLVKLTSEFPAAERIARYLMLEKRLGQLADGKQAWLRQVGSDGRIHARYNPNGTVTGRAAHHNPNIAQVPAVRAPLGSKCRELFTVPEGWVIVGADMSGLELRCLAHYLAPMDGGEYGRIVCEGDPHTVNKEAAGLQTRDQAKTFIYALLYGAGAEKIGKIVGGSKSQGRTLIDRFYKALPAAGELKEKVSHNVRIAGHLRGLDGRLLPIRSEHAALNTLLQSAGAVLCKQWVSDSAECLSCHFAPGWDGEFVLLGWIHDELQIACKKGLEEAVGDFVTTCAKEAGAPFKFRVPLASEYKVGKTWADTH